VADATRDLADLQDVVDRFFAAFRSGPGIDARMDDLRALFVPGAVIVRTCGLRPEVYDVDGFIAPRQALLAGGELADFREWAVSGRLEVFGDVAHWFGSYAKDGLQRGRPIPGRGMKSLQFVRTGAGWRISAAAWDDERDGLGPTDHIEARTSGADVP
jgi:hypothetical protein